MSTAEARARRLRDERLGRGGVVDTAAAEGEDVASKRACEERRDLDDQAVYLRGDLELGARVRGAHGDGAQEGARCLAGAAEGVVGDGHEVVRRKVVALGVGALLARVKDIGVGGLAGGERGVAGGRVGARVADVDVERESDGANGDWRPTHPGLHTNERASTARAAALRRLNLWRLAVV